MIWEKNGFSVFWCESLHFRLINILTSIIFLCRVNSFFNLK